MFLVCLDDCIMGPWKETGCNCSTNTIVAKRAILRNGTGHGVMCKGELEEVKSCDCPSRFNIIVFRNICLITLLKFIYLTLYIILEPQK